MRFAHNPRQYLCAASVLPLMSTHHSSRNAILTFPRLASVFLEEEKGRIYRLRKIKSVLASGQFMGSSTSSTVSKCNSDNNRRRRRPYPDMLQQHHAVRYHHGHAERTVSNHGHPTATGAHASYVHRHKAGGSLRPLAPNYPTIPFGNIVKEAVPTTWRSSQIEHDNNNGKRREGSGSLNGSGVDPPPPAWNANAKFSALGDKNVLGGATVREDNISPAHTNSGLCFYNHGDDASRGGRSLEKAKMKYSSQSSSSLGARSAESGGGHTVSSGPSAIDLFDQCGLVPGPVITAEGLVGTTNSCQARREPTQNDTACEVAHGIVGGVARNIEAFKRNDPASPAPAAAAGAAAVVVVVKPPLVPGAGAASTGFRGSARGHHRSPRRHETRVVHSSRITKTAQTRPSFVDRTISTLPRGCQVHAPAGRRISARGVANRGEKFLRRDVEEDPAGSNRGVARLARSGATCTANASPGGRASKVGSSGKSDRVRRQWNVNNDAVETAVNVSLPPAKADDGEVEVAPPSSEQRLASAQARLHKSKGLEALKSEHAEALSILQDVSCPLTATARSVTGENDDGDEAVANEEDAAVQVAEIKEFNERNLHSKSNRAPGDSVPEPPAPGYSSGGVGRPGAADVDVDALSTDLPRIGSREQAALRLLYRKWWMKVANGGSPTPCTPDFLELSRMQGGGGGGIGTATEGSRQEYSSRDRGAEGEAGGLVVAPSGSMGGSGHGTSGGSSRIRGSVTQDTSGSTEDKGGRRLDPGEAQGAATFVELNTALATAAALGVKSSSGFTRAPETTKGSSETSSEIGLQQRSAAGVQAVDAPGPPINTRLQASLSTPPQAGTVGGTTPMSSSPSRPEAAGAVGPDVQVKIMGVSQEDSGKREEGGVMPTPPVEQFDSDFDSVSEDGDLEGSEEEGHHGRIYLPDGRFFSTIRREDNDPGNNDNDDEVLSNDGHDQGRSGSVVQTSTLGDEGSALLSNTEGSAKDGALASSLDTSVERCERRPCVARRGSDKVAESLDSYAEDGWED